MLIIARHGRTAANAAGLLQGRLDPPLDEVGEAQALRLAAALPGVVRVVASPLVRARQTAAPVALACAVPVEIDERWVELDYGDWDGRPLAEVPPDAWRRWRSDPSFAPPNGESMAAMFERVTAACDDLAEAARDGDVVVVSHVSPIKATVSWALRVGVEVGWRTFLDHASVTRIGMGPNGPVLRGFNDTAHLAG